MNLNIFSKLPLKNNKNGIVLIYVILIGAALLILATMAAVAANASINTSNRGIKGREAYLNSKSGIEFGKVIAESIKSETYNQLVASPGSITALPYYQRKYAYYDETTGFHFGEGVSSSDPDFIAASIQLTYDVYNEVTELPPAPEDPEGQVTYDYNLLLDFSSLGKSSSSALFGFSDNPILLKYSIEPLKGSAIVGQDVEGAPGEIIIGENAAFDCNISADMSCYLRLVTGSDSNLHGSLYDYNNSSSYASNHSILYTDMIEFSATGLVQRANKIYFKGQPDSINMERNNILSPDSTTLISNYIYFQNDIFINNIKDSYVFQILPMQAGGNAIVYFDNVNITVSYYNGSLLESQSTSLNGFYRFNASSSMTYIFNCSYSGGTPTMLWGDFDSAKLVNTSEITTAKENFDPYLAFSEAVGIPGVISGRFAGWSEDSGSLAAYNANAFANSLSFLSPPASAGSNLVLLYANSFGLIPDSAVRNFTGKQIRLAASMSDYPSGFTVSPERNISFTTDLFSYYGDDIIDGGSNNSFTVNSMSGSPVVPVYFFKQTNIGPNIFLPGYSLLKSGANLFSTTAYDTVTPASIETDTVFTGDSVLFQGDTLYFGKNIDVVADGPTCVTIDANYIELSGPGQGNYGELTLDPTNGPITLYIVKDVILKITKKDVPDRVLVLKAGFYSITSTMNLSDLTGDGDTSSPPPGSPPGAYEGYGLTTTTSYSTPIPPIFLAPGVTISGFSSFLSTSPPEMGGIYY